MTNPTSNFGWQMPTPTDLVTDLPADFEVFGQAVDTSMADLKGGTTGQILSKTTNADMDFTWITNDVGDITAVTVSSPLTGGGTSGSISVGILNGTTSNLGAVQLSDSTSSTSTTLAATANAVKTSYDLAAAAVPKSTVTTAGDVIYATGSSAVTRLGIGTAGQILTVNTGATAPEWKTLATTPTFVGVNATRTNVSTTIVANTPLVISFTTEEFDSNGFHDNSTNNSRLTIPTGYAGKYIISGWLTNALGAPGSYQLLRILKNGTQYTGGGVREGEYIRSNTGSNVPFGFAQTISAAVGDYFELSYQQNNGETVNIWSNFQLTYVGA
jgi:hypothetical protein